MTTVIDLKSELLIDSSKVRNPYVRLLLVALGHHLVEGSAWVAVEKEIAAYYRLARQFTSPQLEPAAA